MRGRGKSRPGWACCISVEKYKDELICCTALSKGSRVFAIVLAPLTDDICAIAALAAASRSLTIFSNPATSGFEAQIVGCDGDCVKLLADSMNARTKTGSGRITGIIRTSQRETTSHLINSSIELSSSRGKASQESFQYTVRIGQPACGSSVAKQTRAQLSNVCDNAASDVGLGLYFFD